MSEGLVLAVVGIVGLAVGIWFGLPGRDRPTVEDVERAMDKGGGADRKRLSKRAINPLAWMQRKAQARPSRSRRTPRRGSFQLEAPEDRDREKDGRR
jgi:hypothetical protein